MFCGLCCIKNNYLPPLIKFRGSFLGHWGWAWGWSWEWESDARYPGTMGYMVGWASAKKKASAGASDVPVHTLVGCIEFVAYVLVENEVKVSQGG